jgi:hypothetical protein
MANKATFSPVVSPSIVLGALKTFKDTDIKLNKVVATIAADRSKAVNLVLDAMFIACDKPKAEFLKGNAATNAARYQVKAMFDAIVEAGHLESSTGKSYQTCFWIAFNQGIAWSPDLANKKTADKQAGDTKTEKPTSGKVETTDIPALHKTLSKALAQARLLNQSLFAADLVDLITDTWPDFKETVLTK